MPFDMPAFGYAAVVAGGGILGYVKSHSIPSLAAGLLFGTILGYGAYQTSQDPANIGVLLGTSAALGGVMGYRFYNTGRIMPSGIISVLSVAMIIRTLYKYYQAPALKVQ